MTKYTNDLLRHLFWESAFSCLMKKGEIEFQYNIPYKVSVVEPHEEVPYYFSGKVSEVFLMMWNSMYNMFNSIGYLYPTTDPEFDFDYSDIGKEQDNLLEDFIKKIPVSIGNRRVKSIKQKECGEYIYTIVVEKELDEPEDWPNKEILLDFEDSRVVFYDLTTPLKEENF